MSARLGFTFALVALQAGCIPSFAIDGDGGVPSQPNQPNNPSNPQNPTGGGKDGGVVLPGPDLATPPDLAVDPVAVFSATVAPILTQSCAGCHNKMGGIGPGFLEPHPDMLTTMLAYPGLIGPSPETSRIYVKGAHEGPALSPVDKPVVADWINLWNATRPKVLDGGANKPTVTPFTPTLGAPNAIDLSVLSTAFTGMKVTFNAKMVGTTLELTNISVQAAATMGVHMVHPLWVTWDAQMTPTPDPVDSFSNLDETVLDGESKPMGPGTLFLPNFASTMMINLVFAEVEAKSSGSADGGVGTLGCKSVTTWTSAAKPQLTNNCTSCHGGSNGSATSAFPLQAANGDTQNCANTLGEVNVTTPAMSNMFSYPDPANPNNGHPFHFPDPTTFQNFETAVETWITNEK